ncbi:MAG: T9SS type A sorting domain-containing protein, partial [Bacteroidota bacterium]
NLQFVKEISSTNNLLPADLVSIFPNPASDYLQLDFGDQLPERLQLFSASGKLLSEELVDGSIKQLSIAHLPKGFYIVRSKIEEGWVVSRFVKQ